MPLLCIDEQEDEKYSFSQAVSRALVEVVRQGVEENRVTCGIQECVQLMASCPENVMLCLLVQLSETLGADVKIPLLLIRALCQEKAIDLLHVQGENKMTQLLTACPSQSAKGLTVPGQEKHGASLGCMMIKYPKGSTSTEDDLVAEYVKHKMQNYTDPSVTIPDLTDTGVDKILRFKLKAKKMKSPVQASCPPGTASVNL